MEGRGGHTSEHSLLLQSGESPSEGNLLDRRIKWMGLLCVLSAFVSGMNHASLQPELTHLCVAALSNHCIPLSLCRRWLPGQCYVRYVQCQASDSKTLLLNRPQSSLIGSRAETGSAHFHARDQDIYKLQHHVLIIGFQPSPKLTRLQQKKCSMFSKVYICLSTRYAFHNRMATALGWLLQLQHPLPPFAFSPIQASH